jgi:hypothetical protein
MATVEWNGDEIQRKVEARLVVGVQSAVLFCERIAKQKVSRGNRSGRNPSAPGEPPKRVTGQLRASIGSEVVVEPGRRIVGRFGIRKGSTAEAYGEALERGFTGSVDVAEHIGYRFVSNSWKTKRGMFFDLKAGRRFVRLEPRPYLRPTLSENRAAIEQRITKPRRGDGTFA